MIFIFILFYIQKFLEGPNEIKRRTNQERQTICMLCEMKLKVLIKYNFIKTFKSLYITREEVIFTIRKIVVTTFECHIILLFISWRRWSLYEDIRKQSNSCAKSCGGYRWQFKILTLKQIWWICWRNKKLSQRLLNVDITRL